MFDMNALAIVAYREAPAKMSWDELVNACEPPRRLAQVLETLKWLSRVGASLPSATDCSGPRDSLGSGAECRVPA